MIVYLNQLPNPSTPSPLPGEGVRATAGTHAELLDPSTKYAVVVAQNVFLLVVLMNTTVRIHFI